MALTRSPAFPFIPLEKAIERAREFYLAQRHHPAPASAAVSIWGYKPKSSGGAQTIGALRQFGLLESKGSGQQRTLRLTDLALKILQDQREDSSERDEALEEAAFNPRFHKYLFEKWSWPLPSHETMRFDLVNGQSFTEKAADELIAEYKATMEFAGKAEPIEPVEVEVMDKDEEEPSTVRASWAGLLAKNFAPERLSYPDYVRSRIEWSESTKQDVFNVEEGKVTLQWPDKLSPESFEDIKAFLELAVRKIGRHVVVQKEEPPDPGDDYEG